MNDGYSFAALVLAGAFWAFILTWMLMWFCVWPMIGLIETLRWLT